MIISQFVIQFFFFFKQNATVTREINLSKTRFLFSMLKFRNAKKNRMKCVESKKEFFFIFSPRVKPPKKTDQQQFVNVTTRQDSRQIRFK